MSDKAWKQFERRVAKFFGAKRNSLSGGNSKVSRSDTTHEQLFIECKQRKKVSVWNLYEQTKKLAKKEDKIPVLAIQEVNKKGFLIIVHSDNFKKFLEVIK